jgi:SAM-dependent methyltransferase
MTEITGNLQYGTDTLEVISSAIKFNRWMYETIRPYCKGEILEIGSGIGNISRFFVEEDANITLSDFDSGYFQLLENNFGSNPNMKGIHQIDFSVKDLEEKHPELIGQFDTVFALNVVEHIDDHEQALKNAYKFLRTGGNVVILVPAFQFLYNGFDEQLGHYRRYTGKTLKNLLESSGFQIIHSQYYNFMGMFGWYISGSILRQQMISGGMMRLYDTMVPAWKLVDFFTQRFSGLSVIQAGQKK